MMRKVMQKGALRKINGTEMVPLPFDGPENSTEKTAAKMASTVELFGKIHLLVWQRLDFQNIFAWRSPDMITGNDGPKLHLC